MDQQPPRADGAPPPHRPDPRSIPSISLKKEQSTRPMAALSMSEKQAAAELAEIAAREARRNRFRGYLVASALGFAFLVALKVSGVLDPAPPEPLLPERRPKPLKPLFAYKPSTPVDAEGAPAAPAVVEPHWKANLPAGPDESREAGAVMTLAWGETGESMRFRWIPAGAFVMGSPENERSRFSDEGPLTAVELTSGYWIGETEVTIDQFRRFAIAAGYDTDAETNEKGARGIAENMWRRGFDWGSPGFGQPKGHPVVCVSWRDATRFCEWLTSRVEGLAFHLPTEAQWERAARAGEQTRFWWGDADEEGIAKANGADASLARHVAGDAFAPWNDKEAFSAPVGSFGANAWGLQDMAGNVAEWCRDWFDALPGVPVRDPEATRPSIGRVLRGGSWATPPAMLRAAYRDKLDPDDARSDVGFRVIALPASPSPAPAPVPVAAEGAADASSTP